MSYFDYLSDELYLKIFSKLHQDDLRSAANVCKKWRRIANDAHLWKTLTLYDCRPFVPVLAIIKQCFLVKEIIFEGVGYWRWVCSMFPQCDFLRKFSFRWCDTNYDQMWSIVNYVPMITSVEIIDSEYDGDVVGVILRWRRLKDLSITVSSKNYDASDAVAHLAEINFDCCPNLEKIDLRFDADGFVNDDDFSVFSDTLGCNVKSMSYACVSSSSNSSFGCLKKYSSLTNLTLFNANFMKDDDLMIIRELTALREIRISSRNDKMIYTTSTGFENLFKDVKFPFLTAVYLESCEIDDIGLQYLTKSCPNLTILELHRCKEISNVGLMSITRICRQMENLYLFGLPKIKISGIRKLSASLRNLTRLHVKFCARISSRDVMRLKIDNPSLAFTDRRQNAPRRNEFQMRF